MGNKGLDFKHKEVINITNGKRLRFCTRCKCKFRNRSNYFYNCALKENRFIFDRDIVKNGYVTKGKQHRTGCIIKSKIEYEVVCKVEM